MLLQYILKHLRMAHGFTQEQIAKTLFVSNQAVSKWEHGLSVPSIDNLLALEDLYDISLDELVQGSPYFKKPYLVGNKYNGKKGILFLIVWLFGCLVVYQFIIHRLRLSTILALFPYFYYRRLCRFSHNL